MLKPNYRKRWIGLENYITSIKYELEHGSPNNIQEIHKDITLDHILAFKAFVDSIPQGE